MTTRPANVATFAIVAGPVFVLAMALAVVLHAYAASARATKAQPAVAAFVRATGIVDPCLSTSARWNRTPSFAGHEAALADAPGLRDLDPAGAIVAREAP